MAIVVAVTLIVSALTVIWLAKFYDKRDDMNVINMGTICTTGIEAFGGDIKSINGIPLIDWGTIQLGETKNVSFFLRSTSNIPTKLAFNVTEWNPEGIKTYLTLTWNYNNTYLEPNQEIPVTITLNASDKIDFAKYLISNNVTSYSLTLDVSPIQ